MKRYTIRHQRKRFFWRSSLIIILILLPLFSAWQATRAAPEASLTLGKTLIGEGEDFATRILGQPWDMKSGPYPDLPSVFPQNPPKITRDSFRIDNGMWIFSAPPSSTYDPQIWIHNPGIAETQAVLKLGDRFPINADEYRLISFRLCSSINDRAQVLWYLDQMGGSQLRIGSTDILQIDVKSGCHLYTVDLKKIKWANYPWSGQILGLRIEPGHSGPSADFKLDWIRLTTTNSSHNAVPVQWQSVARGSDLTFYLSRTCNLSDGMPVGEVLDAASQGTFVWGDSLKPDINEGRPYPLPESFEPGKWRVLMQVNNESSVTCSGELTIRPAPIIQFRSPSMESGPDFATQASQDPWGMSNSEDVESAYDVANVEFSDGILNGVAGSIDPYIHLNTPKPIDTSKYHYVTFKTKLDHEAELFVSVNRFIWYYSNPVNDAVTTDDLLLWEGWHTYSFDLRTAYIDPSSLGPKAWTGSPVAFRMDLQEESYSMPVHVDYVMLTGDTIVQQGAPFKVIYNLSTSASTQVQFFYDNDRNASNGRTSMSESVQAAALGTVSPLSVFLPLAMNGRAGYQGESAPIEGSTWMWDTSGVAPGTYYIGAEVSDGVNTTVWYSEVPLIIQ